MKTAEEINEEIKRWELYMKDPSVGKVEKVFIAGHIETLEWVLRSDRQEISPAAWVLR